MNLDENVQQILIGSLLGDGCIRLGKRDRNARFCEVHSLKQSDYLRWKAEIFIKHFGGSVTPYPPHSHYLSKNDGSQIKVKGTGGFALHTRTSPVLTEFYYRWYPNGKKIIPEEDIEKLSPLGLAVWYQDDGCYDYNRHSCEMAINDFKGQEPTIQKFFKDRFGLSPRFTTEPRLRFSSKDSDKFLRLIVDYVHPSMIYKLGQLHSDNRTRIEEVHKKRLQYYRRYRQVNHDRILQQKREYRQRRRDVNEV